MIDHISTHLFLYVFVFATVVMAAVGYFVIAPLERKNHERKLALLQGKIRQHEAQKKGESNITNVADADGA